jgi:hypothetical protein
MSWNAASHHALSFSTRPAAAWCERLAALRRRPLTRGLDPHQSFGAVRADQEAHHAELEHLVEQEVDLLAASVARRRIHAQRIDRVGAGLSVGQRWRRPAVVGMVAADVWSRWALRPSTRVGREGTVPRINSAAMEPRNARSPPLAPATHLINYKQGENDHVRAFNGTANQDRRGVLLLLLVVIGPRFDP